jgi:hypothetical protein
MMTTHTLKIWPQWFREVESGVKTFEIRRDDRGFKVGDLLRLEEFRAGGGEYTGRSVMRRITYISSRQGINVDAEALGLKDGFCVLGLEPVEQQE